MIFQSRSSSPMATLGCLAFGAIFLVGIFLAAQMVFKVFWWLWVGFLIAALLIDWRVVASSLKNTVAGIQREPGRALVSLLLSFPFITLGWFAMAIAKNKMQKFMGRFEQDFRQMGGQGANPFGTEKDTPKPDDYVDYVDIETKPKPK
jgi:hypothetical protein